MKHFVLIPSCVLLVACGHQPAIHVPPFVPSPEQKVKVEIDPRLLQECADLPTDVTIPAPELILEAKRKETVLYVNCKTRHKELADVVRGLIGEKK